MRKIRPRGVLFYFPFFFLLAGAVIHIVGLLNIGNKEIFSLWNLWVHVSMLFINITAFYGLLFRKKWGYYLSIAVFIIFGLLQLLLGILHITSGGKIPFEFQNFGSIIVSFTAVISLYLNNNRFSK